MSGIGHNSAAMEFDFFAFIDMVLATSASTTEKLIAIVHGRQIARRNGESYLSRRKAQDAASVSDNTYQRALPGVRHFLQDTASRGRATVWRARSDITTESVEEAILAMRDAPKACPKSIPQNGVHSEGIPQNGVAGMPQNGAVPTPKMGRHKEQSKDILKEQERMSPNGDSSPIQLSLDTDDPLPASKISFNESGLPIVMNGKRQMLAKILGSRIDVDTALLAIAGDLDRSGDVWENIVAAVAIYAVNFKPKRQRKTVPETYSDNFEAFWNVYPRREGKAEASKSWERLSLEQKRKAYKSLKDQLLTLTAKMRDARGNFCPLPATWINQGRFDDDAASPGTATSKHTRNYGAVR